MFILQYLLAGFRQFWRELTIPDPPWQASKRVGEIMYGVWYERITPEQARKKALDYGFTEKEADEIVAKAKRPSHPSLNH